MNAQEIHVIRAGEELDRLIAVHVMGGRLDCDTLTDGRRSRPVPQYSTDIAAAWEVVEKLMVLNPRLGGMLLEGKQTWGLYLTVHFGELLHCDAETAPLAICRAALLSKAN